MTGSIKLAALFAGAMLILAQGAGTAQAGHGHKEKAFDGQRGTASYGAVAYRHGKAYGKRGKLHSFQAWGDRTYRGDGGRKSHGKHARQRFIHADGGLRLDRGHREVGFFQRGDDGGLSARRRQVNDVVLRRDGETRRVRVVGDGFLRRRSTDGIDASGLSCGTASRVAVVDGRRVRIDRRVCRDADGEIFAVAGSRRIIEYLND